MKQGLVHRENEMVTRLIVNTQAEKLVWKIYEDQRKTGYDFSKIGEHYYIGSPIFETNINEEIVILAKYHLHKYSSLRPTFNAITKSLFNKHFLFIVENGTAGIILDNTIGLDTLFNILESKSRQDPREPVLEKLLKALE
jgi:hypothetical protein